VLYVVTVHFESPRWIEVQRRYLDRHLPRPFEVWTSLQNIDPSYESRFERVFDQKGRNNHASKLNHLASEICDQAADDDVLLFLDGDAFPIADLGSLLSDTLKQVPLIAAQRAENLGDRQPHPCFCVTTVRTWLDLRGDWGAAATWPVSAGGADTGTMSDVGGNLLRRLEVTGTEWLPLLRSNAHNPHPMFFGIYGDLVYHHGAGFRAGGTRIDRNLAQVEPIRLPSARLSQYINRRRYERRLAVRMRRNMKMSWRLFKRMQSGDSSWLDELRGDTNVSTHAATDDRLPREPETGPIH
jgi:hypothetical protein